MTMNADQQFKRLEEDLHFALGFFPTSSLEHVRENKHRLTRGTYSTPDGKGCLFNLLSEPLPAEFRIDSRQSLTRFFTGNCGFPSSETTVYQPARYIVRAIDNVPCARYGFLPHVSWDFILGVIDEEIDRRRKIETEAADVERVAKMRMLRQRSARRKAGDPSVDDNKVAVG